MECIEVREFLHECDLAELLEEGVSPAAQHLSRCADCRKIADEMVNAQSALNAHLESRRPSRSFEELVESLGTVAEEKHASFFRPLPLILSTAAAAILLVVALPLFSRKVDLPIEGISSELRAELPVVQAPSEKTALILDSGNPDYQIIWLF
jgi:hypothetical protein